MSDEEQQVETIKRWWKEYGLATITGVILAIIIVLGWQYYQRYQVTKRDHASVAYETLVTAQMSGDEQRAQSAANLLINDYKHSAYTQLAEFWLAKMALEKEQYTLANNYLNNVATKAKEKAWRDIARIRLARIDLQQNQAQQALMELKTIEPGFNGLANVVRGDAYAQLHQPVKAKTAYQQALKQLPLGAPINGLVKMKLANLPA